MKTEAEMQALFDSDPGIGNILKQIEEHRAKEEQRVAELGEKIGTAWKAVRELKGQRSELTKQIHNRETAIKAMVRRTRIRKPNHLHARIAARKVSIRRKEEAKVARAAKLQAIAEFRKSIGIPAAGLGSVSSFR